MRHRPNHWSLMYIQYVIEILVMYNVPQTAKKNPIPFGRSHRFLTFSIHTLDNVCLIKSKCDIIESHVCFSLLCFPLFRMKIVISMSVFCNGDGFCKWPNYAGIGVSISTLFYSHSTWRKWNEKQEESKKSQILRFQLGQTVTTVPVPAGSGETIMGGGQCLN